MFGEVWGAPERSGEVWGALDRSGEVWGAPERSWEVWGAPEKVWGGLRMSGELQRGFSGVGLFFWFFGFSGSRLWP